MKNMRKIQVCLASSLFGLCLAGSVAISRGQTFTNQVISTFDTPNDPFSTLYQWWGLGAFTAEWDGSENAPTTLIPGVPSTSGALKCTADWTGTSGNDSSAPQPQLMLWNALSGREWDTSRTVNGYYYDLDFDLKLDPNSAKTTNGDFGSIEAGAVLDEPAPVNWTHAAVWSSAHYTTNGWAHIHAYIDPTIDGIDAIAGFYLYWPWQTDGTGMGALQGLQTFWVDNIEFTADTNKPVGPPTLTLAPDHVAGGLNLSSGGVTKYDRNSIMTMGNNSWVSSPTPVTYSFTIASYPGTNYPGYQTHIFLASNPGTENAPDWNEPSCVFLQLQNYANGTAQAIFRYKVNEPNGNSMYWNSQDVNANGYGKGTLGSVTCTNGPLGTWSMTFDNDTNITLTAPDGETSQFAFPDEGTVLTYFEDSVVAWFGAMPNSDGNVGQTVIISHIKITGTANPIDENFSSPELNTNVWTISAVKPADVFVTPSDIAYALNWTLPDANYQLQAAASLDGPWTNANFGAETRAGAIRQVLIPQHLLPSATSSFFRLSKAVATKLQVVLPGESSAPGTPTGKTGTPTAETAGVPFDVTVNAVDDSWNIVPYVRDTVGITSTDATAALPGNAALANGTGTFSVTFGTSGTYTVTATDVSTDKIAAGTSASVTAQ